MSDDFKGDPDATRVADISKLRAQLTRRSERDRAYLIVLAGADVGKMFKLTDGLTVIGRSHKADIRLDDDSISRRHINLRLDGNVVRIEDLGSSNGTLVNDERVGQQPLSDGDKIRLGDTTILKFTFHDKLDESFQKKMYDAALRDPLTKIFNKKHFLDTMDNEVSYARRHGAPLSLVMFDLDHFKKVNDGFGHIAGDHALVIVADLVQEMLRTEDIFARYGGEEFVVILRGTPLDQAGVLAERVRAAIDNEAIMFGDATLPVTISVGVAQFQPEMSEPVDLVKAADEALYAAKESGRNRVLLKQPS